jgi:hypothetical protein
VYVKDTTVKYFFTDPNDVYVMEIEVFEIGD